MRIACMVASQYSLPLREDIIYAPYEIATEIADSLTAHGHEVTFYGPPSPGFRHKVISGRLERELNNHPIFAQGGAREREKVYNLFDQYLLMLLYKDAQAGKYDLAHIHPIDRAMPLADLAPIPTVYTLHDPIYPWRAHLFNLYVSPRQHIVSISNNQRSWAPHLNYAKTIYNGTDTKKYAFSGKAGDGFMFCGRLLPQKGVKEAAMAANLIGAKLDIVGRTYPENTYFQDDVSPHLNERVRVLEVGRDELPGLYGRAKALLFPILWEEPFGLVMVEAMSCGTPVIAFRHGSVPEVVKDGVTGFIVDSVEEMAEAMKKIDRIDRRACRKWVEDNFSVERMTAGYESLFLDLVKNRAG